MHNIPFSIFGEVILNATGLDTILFKLEVYENENLAY